MRITTNLQFFRQSVTLFLLVGLSVACTANAQSLRASVVSAGGATMSGASFSLRSTVGQPAAGRTSTPAQSFAAGFLYLASGANGTSVGIEDDATLDESGAPTSYSLDGNFPNPFNGQTSIPFALPEPSDVRIALYDIVGREVRVLVDGTLSAGRHTVAVVANDLPSGVYFYRLTASEFSAVRSMQVVK